MYLCVDGPIDRQNVLENTYVRDDLEKVKINTELHNFNETCEYLFDMTKKACPEIAIKCLDR
jgi:hypothetical protein